MAPNTDTPPVTPAPAHEIPSSQSIVSPQALDFGTLMPGDRQTQTFTIGRPPFLPQDFAVTCDEQPTWFRIAKTEALYEAEPFPLRVEVAVDADVLMPGMHYEAWLYVEMDEVSIPMKLTAECQKKSVPRLALHWVAVLLITVGTVIALSTVMLLRTTAIQRVLAASDSLSTSPPDQLIFSADENGVLVLYTFSAVRMTQQSLDVMGHAPIWSPDGSQVAFIADQHGTAQLYMLNPDSGDVRQLTASAGDKSAPKWSGDGSHIAFLSDQNGSTAPPDLWVISVASDALRRLTTAGCPDYGWAPVGNRLAYITGNASVSSPLLYLWMVTPATDPHLVAEVSEPRVSWRP